MKIVVIAAEGDSAETEQLYVEKVKSYYGAKCTKLEVVVFVLKNECNAEAIDKQIKKFIHKHGFDKLCAGDKTKTNTCDCNGVELHAQAGLGCLIAWRWLQNYPQTVARAFMIGGSPAKTMTWIAKVFHRYVSRLWYWSPFKFFADDPNPHDDPEIAIIKQSSTDTMRENPKLYCDELVALSRWEVPEWAKIPEGCEVFYVPNGLTVRPKWWDNTYDAEKAEEFWLSYGAKVTRQPRDYFSLYTLMPAKELFSVMDEVRELE